jgi:hypothetical protein
MKISHLSSVLLVAVFGAGAIVPVHADLATPADTAASSGNSGTAQSQPITGSVKKVEISLESLRDMGLDLKEVMTSARHLYDEVSIQPVQVITQPELIGPGSVINIPIGTVPIGPPQPPRKSRVDLAMKNLSPIIDMLKGNADDFVAEEKQLDVTPEVQAKLNPLVQDWITKVNQIYGELQQLQPLTAGPTYDNAAIAAVCRNMQNTAQDLDKTRSKAFKIIKREGRRW